MIKLLQSKYFYLGILRYVLALAMIPYAITKILRTQFVLLPVGISQMPLEQIDGAKLAWAFLGYSPWFQVLLGFLELIPALLLLFRKTALAGALLMLPMTLNVCLINFALDLWADTQVISILLLLLNILILIFYWSNLKSILHTVFRQSRTRNLRKPEWIINLILVIGVIYSNVNLLSGYIRETDELTGDWYHQRPIEWKLIQKDLNGITQPLEKKTIYFGAYGNYGTIGKNGKIKHDFQYKLIHDHQMLELTNLADRSKIDYSFQIKNDSMLVLGSKNADGGLLTETYQRRVIRLGKK